MHNLHDIPREITDPLDHYPEIKGLLHYYLNRFESTAFRIYLNRPSAISRTPFTIMFLHEGFGSAYEDEMWLSTWESYRRIVENPNIDMSRVQIIK